MERCIDHVGAANIESRCFERLVIFRNPVPNGSKFRVSDRTIPWHPSFERLCAFKSGVIRSSACAVLIPCLGAVASWSLAVILVSRDVAREICRGSGGHGKDEHSFTERGRPSQMAGPPQKVRTKQANFNTGWSDCVKLCFV